MPGFDNLLERAGRAGRSVWLWAVAAMLVPSFLTAAGVREQLGQMPLTPALGGETTRPLATVEAFTFVTANASDSVREAFQRGNVIFNQAWDPLPGDDPTFDGLGPVFNQHACADCHINNGRGRAPAGPDEPMESALVRISLPARRVTSRNIPRPVPRYGDQIQDQAIAGVPAEGRVRVSWSEIPGRYGDGTHYSLRTPTVAITDPAFGPLPEDTLYSLRVANPMIGLGLLELVSEDTLNALTDPQDVDGDGISGVVNRVWDPRDKVMAVGRFGWKANVPNITSQTAGAAQGDMGITSDVVPQDNCVRGQDACRAAATHDGVEMTAAMVRDVNVYSRRLAVPRQRGGHRPQVRQGYQRFLAAGCAGCHLPTLITGEDPRAADLSGQVFHPFTDLLLHDMGEGLADGRPDFAASGREWRTAPLWGIGLTARVSGHTEFLHDGRARSLAEAILWHGGEAEAARETFRNLPASQRAELLVFLESL
jgi:CxxC motif-containing protein (DUF1111 family)